MATPLWRRFGLVWILSLAFAGAATPVHADEIWVAPTSQADLGGLSVASNVFWPVTPLGAVRLAWAIPADLQTFQNARLVLIPSASSPTPVPHVLSVPRAIESGGHGELRGSVHPGLYQHGEPVARNRHDRRRRRAPRQAGRRLPERARVHVAHDRDRSHRRPAVPLCAGARLPAPRAWQPTRSPGHRPRRHLSVTVQRSTNLPVPNGVATLGANTFAGTQTAPAFVGSGAGLTGCRETSGQYLRRHADHQQRQSRPAEFDERGDGRDHAGRRPVSSPVRRQQHVPRNGGRQLHHDRRSEHRHRPRGRSSPTPKAPTTRRAATTRSRTTAPGSTTPPPAQQALD